MRELAINSLMLAIEGDVPLADLILSKLRTMRSFWNKRTPSVFCWRLASERHELYY